MSSHRLGPAATFGVFSAIALVVGCGSSDAAPEAGNPDAGANVVASISVWADVAEAITCGSVEVETLIPRGADTHAYELSLADRVRLDEADVVLVNGLGLEASAEDVFDDLAAEGVTVVRIAEADDADEHDDDGADQAGDANQDDDHDDGDHDDGDHDDGDHDHDHHHDGEDPHIWFDPSAVTAMLPALGEHLVEAGADPATVERCIDEYSSEIDAVDAEIEALFAPIEPSQRVFITNHGGLSRFADHYDLTLLGTVLSGTSTLEEADPALIDELESLIVEQGITQILVEAEASAPDAEALAARLDLDLAVVHIESLGPDGSEADTYLGLLRSTAEAIAAGMQ